MFDRGACVALWHSHSTHHCHSGFDKLQPLLHLGIHTPIIFTVLTSINCYACEYALMQSPSGVKGVGSRCELTLARMKVRLRKLMR